MKLSILICLLLFYSCSFPSSILRLTPKDKTSFWVDGKNVVSLNKDSLKIAVAFVSDNNRKLEFHVEIQNNKSQTILFEPTDSYYFTYNDTINNIHSNLNPSYTIDPVAQHDFYNQRIENETTSYQNSNSVSGFFSFLGLIGDIASIGAKKTQKEIDEKNASDTEDELRKLTDEIINQENPNEQ